MPIAEVYFDKTKYMGISQEARNSLFDIAEAKLAWQAQEQAILKAKQEREEKEQAILTTQKAIIALHLQNMTKETIAAIFAMDTEMVEKIIMDYQQNNKRL